MPNIYSKRTTTPPATRTVNDCAWCGDGEGICQTHLDALLVQSVALAATGQYRARDDRESQAQRVPPLGVEDDQEVTA